jgi:hypothetical protein
MTNTDRSSAKKREKKRGQSKTIQHKRFQIKIALFTKLLQTFVRKICPVASFSRVNSLINKD